MPCIKCKTEIYVDEKSNQSNLGIQIINHVFEEYPKEVMICIPCAEELGMAIMTGKFSAIMGLGKLIKGGS